MDNLAASPLVLAGLIRKRAELAGEIQALTALVANLQADLAHLDAAIRIMDPAADPQTIRPKVPRNRCDWFGRGELFRLTMEALRTAPEPMTAMEIARMAVARKGIEAASPFVVQQVKSMIDATLRRREGLMERVVFGRRHVAWRVAALPAACVRWARSLTIRVAIAGPSCYTRKQIQAGTVRGLRLRLGERSDR